VVGRLAVGGWAVGRVSRAPCTVHRVTVSPCHRVTVSLCQRATCTLTGLSAQLWQNDVAERGSLSLRSLRLSGW
jgi:hypothetical protein